MASTGYGPILLLALIHAWCLGSVSANLHLARRSPQISSARQLQDAHPDGMGRRLPLQDGLTRAIRVYGDATPILDLSLFNIDNGPFLATSYALDAPLNYTYSGWFAGWTSLRNFAVQWTGQVAIGTGGTYTFHVKSADGSHLYINDVLVVDNEGLATTEPLGRERSGDVVLASGLHALDLRYFCSTLASAPVLVLSYTGPDTNGVQEVVPASVLHKSDPDKWQCTEPLAVGPLHDFFNGTCLDWWSDGGVADYKPCNGLSNQQWILCKDGTVRNGEDVHTCLTIRDGLDAVTVLPCMGASDQEWEFHIEGTVDLIGPLPYKIPSRQFSLKHAVSRVCLGGLSRSASTTWGWCSTFFFRNYGAALAYGRLQISVENSTKCLGAVASGVQPCSTAVDQYYMLYESGEVMNAHTRECLDIISGEGHSAYLNSCPSGQYTQWERMLEQNCPTSSCERFALSNAVFSEDFFPESGTMCLAVVGGEWTDFEVCSTDSPQQLWSWDTATSQRAVGSWELVGCSSGLAEVVEFNAAADIIDSGPFSVEAARLEVAMAMEAGVSFGNVTVVGPVVKAWSWMWRSDAEGTFAAQPSIACSTYENGEAVQAALGTCTYRWKVTSQDATNTPRSLQAVWNSSLTACVPLGTAPRCPPLSSCNDAECRVCVLMDGTMLPAVNLTVPDGATTSTLLPTISTTLPTTPESEPTRQFTLSTTPAYVTSTRIAGLFDFTASGATLNAARRACVSTLAHHLELNEAAISCTVAVPRRIAAHAAGFLDGGFDSAPVFAWDISFSVAVPYALSDAAHERLENVASNSTAFAQDYLLEMISHEDIFLTQDLLESTYSFGTFGVRELGVVQELLANLEQARQELVEDLIASESRILTEDFQTYVLVGQKLNSSELSEPGGVIKIPVVGGTEVTIPDTLFTDLKVIGNQDIVLVFAALGNSSQEEDSSTVVFDSLSLDVYNDQGAIYTVAALSKPIRFTLKAADDTAICSYWDEDLARWSEEGISTGGVEDGELQCATVHLSLFGGIVRGFAGAFFCNQALLFSKESFDELTQGEWRLSWGALLLWFWLFLAVAYLVAAMVIDHRRDVKWDDKHFLITEREPPSGSAEALPKVAATVQAISMTEVLCDVVGSGMRDILDDITSSCFAFSGEVRNIAEAICEATCAGGGGEIFAAGPFALFALAAKHLLDVTAHRNTCASLKYDHTDEHIVAGESALEETLSVTKENSDAGAMQATKSARFEQQKGTLARIQNTYEQQRLVEESRLHRWTSCPGMLWKNWVNHGVLGSSLVFSMSMPSGLRALLVMCDFLGALLVSTIFLESESLTPSKRDRSLCEAEGFGERIGRLMALAVAAGLLAALPIAILSRLHSRSFTRVDYEGGRLWKRQLRAWIFRDLILWLLALSYAVFCTLYLCLFFANVAEEDHAAWLFMAFLSFLDDFIVTPLAACLVPPLLGLFLVSCLSVRYWKPRKEILQMLKDMESKRQSGSQTEEDAASPVQVGSNVETAAAESNQFDAGFDNRNPTNSADTESAVV
mmetsp:Transcript_37000/g.86727  ORF Transcript_37000/g.86727 Transcript_37000/m.86727 type:complete len:1531 (-) Transcript_37000:22-4614(-)